MGTGSEGICFNKIKNNSVKYDDIKNVVFLCSALLCSCSEDVDLYQSDLNNHSVKINRNALYRCPPEELCKNILLKNIPGKKRKQ